MCNAINVGYVAADGIHWLAQPPRAHIPALATEARILYTWVFANAAYLSNENGLVMATPPAAVHPLTHTVLIVSYRG